MAFYNNFRQLQWDRRVTAIAMYVLVPALFGTITRVMDWNPMLGDFSGIDLDEGIIQAFFVQTTYVVVCILFFLMVARVKLRPKQVFQLNHRRVEKLGMFVLAYQFGSLAYTLQSGLGIAASSQSVDGNAKIIFILLSSDYIFFVFFLLARDRSKLVWWNGAIYLTYSIMRGWASGILLLLILSYIKYPMRVKKKKIFAWVGVLFLVVPILMGARDFFRSGGAERGGLVEAVSLAVEDVHYDDVFYLLVNRFDLVPPTQTFAVYYKNLLSELDSGAVCYPWNEGIYQTVINALLKKGKCVPVGEALPSMIHGQFYFYRRTSFSIGAGWLYGADFLTAIVCALYIGFLITWARLLAGPLVQIPAIRAFGVFLIVFYMVPGWYFHYIQAINAVLFVNIFLRLNFVKRRPLFSINQESGGRGNGSIQ